jgi:hypothetical protein
VDARFRHLELHMPLVLQQRGPNKMPRAVQARGPGCNKMAGKQVDPQAHKAPQLRPIVDASRVRQIHDWNRRNYDAIEDLDPLIDEMEAGNAVTIDWNRRNYDAIEDLDPLIDEMEAGNAAAAFVHLPLQKDVEQHILTFVARGDAN